MDAEKLPEVNTPVLYLIPTVLAGDTAYEVLPASVIEAVKKLDVFFVENVRTARRFISSLRLGKVIDELTFFELNKDTPREITRENLKALKTDAGIISEAGVPCVADPGSTAVALAHELGYRVKPLTGPSSILLALMGSGFGGQLFVFHGYLPIERTERIRAIQQMERQVMKTGQTQIFMETPYRNNQLFQTVLDTCQAATKFCVASNITAPEELIKTCTIKNWVRQKPDLNKQPTIFLLGN